MNEAATASRKPKALDPEDLAAGLIKGEVLPLSRAITILENDLPPAPAILRALQPHLGRALVVGITGAPGVGKSTLVNAYITHLRQADKSVGVIAVDPSSPISGGAILGDRLRMVDHTSDPGVYVRSLASRGALGGLAPLAARVIDALDAAGKDVIIVETVGTGQSEVEVAAVADIKVVVTAPGLGDDIQAIKAGILEIADVLVVNKADLPLAEATASQLKSMLGLRRGARAAVPVVKTDALDRTGIDELAAAIDACAGDHGPATRAALRRRRGRRLIAEAAMRTLRQRLIEDGDDLLDALGEAVQRGELDLDSAVQQWLAARIEHD